MAVPEYDDYSPGQDSGQQVPGDALARRNPAGPIPATDYLSGACAQRQNSQVHTSVLCARAQVVTSVSGSPSMNFICRATVIGAQEPFGFVPTGGDMLNRTDSLVVPSILNSERERQSSPHLSLSSLETTAMTSVARQETGNGEEDKAIREEANITQLPHTECQPREGRLHTSGYVSQSLGYGLRESRNQASALSHSYRAIKLSEPVIHEIIARSGTNRDPCFPEFRSFQARITSFTRTFRLDGERFNRDMLALAGFFYTRSGDGHETVVCYHCGCSPRVWRDGQEPLTEHRHLSPYCRALPRI